MNKKAIYNTIVKNISESLQHINEISDTTAGRAFTKARDSRRTMQAFHILSNAISKCNRQNAFATENYQFQLGVGNDTSITLDVRNLVNNTQRTFYLDEKGELTTLNGDYVSERFPKIIDDIDNLKAGQRAKYRNLIKCMAEFNTAANSPVNESLDPDEDGWNEYDLEELIRVLDEAYDLAYEIKNCVRGCNSGCTTYEELSEYVYNLGTKLCDVGSEIKYY